MNVLTRTFTVVAHQAEEGGYWGEVIELPGCASQGETLEEFGRNIREAIEAVLQADTEGVRIDLQVESLAAEFRASSGKSRRFQRWPTEGTGTWTVAH